MSSNPNRQGGGSCHGHELDHHEDYSSNYAGPSRLVAYNAHQNDSRRQLDEQARRAGDESEALIRSGYGSPPRTSYLTPATFPLPPSNRHQPRLPQGPSFNTLLARTRVEFEDCYYLPLTSVNIDLIRLHAGPLGSNTNASVFRRIVIPHEVNDVYTHHVMAALRRIDGHCRHVIVMSDVRTFPDGDVFFPWQESVSNINDWIDVLGSLHNLETITLVCPDRRLTRRDELALDELDNAVSRSRYARRIRVYVAEASDELLQFFND